MSQPERASVLALLALLAATDPARGSDGVLGRVASRATGAVVDIVDPDAVIERVDVDALLDRIDVLTDISGMDFDAAWATRVRSSAVATRPVGLFGEMTVTTATSSSRDHPASKCPICTRPVPGMLA